MTRLATRCGQCGTSFRVSEEQLAISDGYVRCGRCDAVFNAREALFDLEGGGMLSAPMPLAGTEAPISRPAALPEPEPDRGPATEVMEEPEPQATEPWPDDVVQQRQEPAWEPEPTSAAPVADPNQDLRDLLGVPAPEPTAPALAPAVFSSLGGRRASRGVATSPWPLRLGGLLAAVLALALPLQWAWVEREALRAGSPQLDQWLRQVWPSLRSDGLRRLDSLSVAASSLLATPQGGAYQLDLTLHNRGAQALALPWVDLRLSDVQGRVLVRKALAPAELNPAGPLQPGEQRRVQMVFRVQEVTAAVSGYEVGLFHP